MAKLTIREKVVAWFEDNRGKEISPYVLARDLSDGPTQFRRTWRAIRELIWDGLVKPVVKLSPPRCYYVAYASAHPWSPKTAKQILNYRPSEHRDKPKKRAIDFGKAKHQPIRVLVPLHLASHPHGVTVNDVQNLVGTTQWGTVQNWLLREVHEGNARLQLRWQADVMEEIFIPNDDFVPRFSDYVVKSKKTKQHTQVIKARVMAFMLDRLKQDGELRTYSLKEMNKVVDAARTRNMSLRCQELAKAGELKLEAMPHGIYDYRHGDTTKYKLGFRHWMLWQAEQKEKPRREQQEALSAPRFVDADLEP